MIEAEEEVGFRDPVVGLETAELLTGRLQTTRAMADLVLEMVTGLNKDQGQERKNNVSNGVVEMRKLVLIVGALNIPHHLVTILLGLADLLLKEVDRLKEVLLRGARWSLPCLIILMALLCEDYLAVCLYQICLARLKCSCLFLVLGKP